MRLSTAQAAKLAQLDRGESMPKSKVPKWLLHALQEAHAVHLEKSGSSYVVRGVPGEISRLAEYQWGIRDLVKYAKATPENRNRSLLTAIAGDSKALPTSPLKGIFIRSFGGCYLNNQALGTTPQGSALLITFDELPNLRIETSYLIGVENVECLWKFEKALRLFPELNEVDYALVLRWHWNKQWQNWLKQWQGKFCYFPDYDPSGISIFVAEVLRHRDDAQILIPKEFDKILEHRGSRDLYHKQEESMPLRCEHTQVVELCETLRRNRKGLEQEELLSDKSSVELMV